MALENLARSLDSDVLDGEELIVTGEHEGKLFTFRDACADLFKCSKANVGPWKKLAKRRGLAVKVWPHTRLFNASANNPYAVGLQIDALLPLITSKTRIVAFTATSNILGSVVDVEVVAKAIRAKAEKK